MFLTLHLPTDFLEALWLQTLEHSNLILSYNN
jgi:hypothetical protein